MEQGQIAKLGILVFPICRRTLEPIKEWVLHINICTWLCMFTLCCHRLFFLARGKIHEYQLCVCKLAHVLYAGRHQILRNGKLTDGRRMDHDYTVSATTHTSRTRLGVMYCII